MISEASARKRTLIALAVCAVAAIIAANQWVAWIYPSFCGGAFSDFKVYPHRLFMPAAIAAYLVNRSGSGLRLALFCEAFLICFAVIFFIYFFVAYVFRRGNA